jgi:hypothetical protein
MGRLTAQLEETIYSFSGGDKEVRFVEDEVDEVRRTVSHRSVCQQMRSEEPLV